MLTPARLRLIPLILVVPLWIVLLINEQFGVDFYPLYFAAQRILAGLSPYGPEATARLAAQWQAPFAQAGIAYPLPLLLLVVPLALLPFAAALALWVGLGGVGALRALQLSPDWWRLSLLPFLFLPLHRSVALGQATLLWFGLAVALVLAIRARQPWLVGVATALLLLKPQNGVLFGLAGLIWAAYHERRALLWFAGTGVGLLGVSLLVQPAWLLAWLEQLQRYNAVVQPPSLLPAGLLVILSCWRLPWWARVAAAQVVLFPLSDLYSALPLLLCWVSIGGPVALLGAGISWLWSILGLPNTLEVLWAMVLCPLMLAAVWRGWLQPWGERRSAAATGAGPLP